MPDSATPNTFGYNGEQTDYSSGLQYLRARYYSSDIQRFVQEDDFKGKYTNPASMNRYIYTEGNPVMGVDPSGYDTLSDFKKIQDINKKIVNLQKQIDRLKGTPGYTAMTVITNELNSAKRERDRLKTGMKTVSPSQYLEQGNNGGNVSDDTVIIPESLVPGEAGYVNGRYCLNVYEDEQVKKLLDAGLPLYIFKSSMIELMSEEEVNERNEVLYEAIKPMNVVWQSPVYISGYNKRHFNEGTVYRGVIYSMNSYHDSPEEFMENVSKGEGALYRANDNYHLSGEDCSGSDSRAWGMIKRTTLGIHDNITGIDGQEQGIYKIGEYNMENYYIASREEAKRQLDLIAAGEMKYPVSKEEKDTLIEAYEGLAPGDQVYKRGLEGHHVMTVLEIDGDNVIFVEQTQSTTHISKMSFEDLSDDLYMPITKWDD